MHISVFSAYHDGTVASAKIKEIQIEDPSTDEAFN